MTYADAVLEILKMRGQISAKQKLKEIRGVFKNEEIGVDLNAYVACVRGGHSSKNKGCRSKKRGETK